MVEIGMRKTVSFCVLFLILLSVFSLIFFKTPGNVLASSTHFYCLGSCPTPLPKTKPTGTAPTIKVTSNNAGDSLVHTQIVHTEQKKNNGFFGSFFIFLQFLFDLLFRLLGGGTPPVTPTPTPTIAPTVPLPSPTQEVPTPTLAIPTITATPTGSPSGLISVADLKYVPHGEPTVTYNWVATTSGQYYTFNGTVPGTKVDVHVGDHVHVNILNELPVGLSIHWHGLAVPNASDGVPGATQDAIKPGQTYTYDFVANEPGTYFYHTHQDTFVDMPKGLYGELNILPAQDKFTSDLDYTVFYRNITSSDPQATQHFDAAPGQKVRLRIVDARNGDFSGAPVMAALIGVPFKVIALDGRELNAPQYIQNQLLPINMAQRYDLLFTMPQSGSVELVEGSQDQAGDHQEWTFGSGPINNPPANINTLPSFNFTNYGLPAPDDALPPNGVYDKDFTMNIGENLSINGQLFPHVPDLVVHQGDYVHIRMNNNSDMWHAMHLHGGYFTVTNMNGTPITGSPIHMDTVLIPPFQTSDIVYHATDPGVWMFHCHILPHAAGGLMMMLRTDNVYTPYSTDPASGNIPE